MPEKYKWIVCKSDFDKQKTRTCHQATIHKNKLYVWGGNDTILYCCNLVDFKWYQPKVTGDIPTTPNGFVSFSSSTSNYKKWFIFSQSIGFRSFEFEKYHWTKEYYDENDLNCPKSRFKETLVCFKDYLIYMFGGYVSRVGYSNDLFEYNIEKKTWKCVEQKGIIPERRYCHSAVVYNDSMYIFGGYNGITKFSDLHKFHFSTCTWQQIITQTENNKPFARFNHTANVYAQKMIIFGGSSSDSCIYEYNFRLNNWKKIKMESKHIRRSNHAAVIYDGYLFVIGGIITKFEENRGEIVKVYLGNDEEFQEKLVKSLKKKDFIDIKILFLE